MKKTYIEPKIVDYGSIAEMTAGRSYRENADTTIPAGNGVLHETTGPCYPGYSGNPCKL